VIDPDERVLADDELNDADRLALGWAVTSGHEIGAELLARAHRGDRRVRAGELARVRDDWREAGSPWPERHVHRTRVTFSDGTAIVGVSFTDDEPYARDHVPSFGLYLDERWHPPWPHEHIDWPDFGVPADVDALRSALRHLLDRARDDGVVEIGCLGGHGRTGTALACLAVLTGTPPADAVEWVREHYCEQAVETDEQRTFVAAFTR
jgi:hypothetical protein